jgi:D-glycero-D-manno-heptose 1,7-bisphosphate phosphatase
MGTPERYKLVCRDIKENRIPLSSKRRKAIFLDRDGTINRYAGFVKSPEDFELLPDIPEAIRLINMSGYLAIVVSNQPVIARGEVTEDELVEIHNKMETLLGNDGAYLDAIYYCPHHPDSGFDGEIPELKIKCKCRKPEPGMLIRAAEDFDIDLESSWIIGDSWRDIKAGKAAGCKTVLIGTDTLEQDITVESLYAAVRKVLVE